MQRADYGRMIPSFPFGSDPILLACTNLPSYPLPNELGAFPCPTDVVDGRLMARRGLVETYWNPPYRVLHSK